MEVRMAVRILRSGALFALVLVALTGTAHAENVIVFDDSVITGEIEKPEAFIILSPSNLDYEAVDEEDSFLDELYESTRDDEF
jgi:hypothetical protein